MANQTRGISPLLAISAMGGGSAPMMINSANAQAGAVFSTHQQRKTKTNRLHLKHKAKLRKHNLKKS